MRKLPTPLRIAITLLLGAGAGGLFYSLGLPLPWMLGPMLLCAGLSLMGVGLKAPTTLRPLLLPVIGVMMGSRLTTEMFGSLAEWATTLMLLPLFILAALMSSYLIYRHVVKLDPVTAFYSAMPGGFQEMLVMGAEAGGDERQLAIAHSVRIMLTIFGVALIYALFFGVTSASGGAQWLKLTDISLKDYALLGGCALLGHQLAKWIKLPAGSMLAPMILSGAVHMLGWATLPPPSLLVTAALITLGTVTGCRFLGMEPKAVLNALFPSAFIAVVMLGLSAIFAVSASFLGTMPFPQTFLAFAAGGVTEMGLLTFALNLDVAYVSIMHILRIFLVVLCAQPLFYLLRK